MFPSRCLPYHLLHTLRQKSGKPPASRLAGAYFAVHVQEITDFLDYRASPYQNRASENVLCKQAIFAVTILALLIAYVHYTIFRELGKSKHSLLKPFSFISFHNLYRLILLDNLHFQKIKINLLDKGILREARLGMAL